MATMSTSTSSIKGRVLIVGATGLIGRFVAEASLDSGRPTYLLTRTPSFSTSPAKAQALKSLEERGAIILQGSISDKESIESILKDNEIEVVISIVGGGNLLDQLTLVQAIKSVGTVKFGHDVDRADPVEPGLGMYLEKRQASWPYYDNTHPSDVPPPIDRLSIYAYFVTGPDIGKFTIKTLDDARTINKSIHFRPAVNYYNMNELASLWEKKIGRTIPRVTVTESDLLAIAAENRIPESIVAAFTHDIFVKGCQSNFKLDGVNDLEASTLYPDEAFETVDKVFGDFALTVQQK
ncbi:Leucoanthocyanidin reductase [Linum perenne]